MIDELEESARITKKILNHRYDLRDKFFLNGKAKYEQEKVERWYKRFGRKIIEKYRTGQLSVLTFIFKVLPILNKK